MDWDAHLRPDPTSPLYEVECGECACRHTLGEMLVIEVFVSIRGVEWKGQNITLFKDNEPVACVHHSDIQHINTVRDEARMGGAHHE